MASKYTNVGRQQPEEIFPSFRGRERLFSAISLFVSRTTKTALISVLQPYREEKGQCRLRYLKQQTGNKTNGDFTAELLFQKFFSVCHRTFFIDLSEISVEMGEIIEATLKTNLGHIHLVLY